MSRYELKSIINDPRIYENSIFPAYVPEKNKIITPCLHGVIGNNFLGTYAEFP